MENLNGEQPYKAYLPNENTKYFNGELNLMDWLRQYVPPHVTDVDEPFLTWIFGEDVIQWR